VAGVAGVTVLAGELQRAGQVTAISPQPYQPLEAHRLGPLQKPPLIVRPAIRTSARQIEDDWLACAVEGNPQSVPDGPSMGVEPTQAPLDLQDVL